jgi:hypothetical protein
VATTRRLLLCVAVTLVAAAGVAFLALRLDGPTYDRAAPPAAGDPVIRWNAYWLQQRDGPAEVCWVSLDSDPPQCGGGPTIYGIDLSTTPGAEADPYGNDPGVWMLFDVELDLVVASDGTFHHLDHRPVAEEPPEPATIECPVPEQPADPLDVYNELTAGETSVFDELGDNVLSMGAGNDLGFDVVYATQDVVDELCGLTNAVTTITPEGVILDA